MLNKPLPIVTAAQLGFGFSESGSDAEEVNAELKDFVGELNLDDEPANEKSNPKSLVSSNKRLKSDLGDLASLCAGLEEYID